MTINEVFTVERVNTEQYVVLTGPSCDVRIEVDVFDVLSQRYVDEASDELQWANSLVGETLLFRNDSDGTLRIVRDGDEIAFASPSYDFESWEIWRNDGSGAVCMPGGEIAYWGPRPD